MRKSAALGAGETGSSLCGVRGRGAGMTINVSQFKPAGPIAAKFINSDARNCGIMGPMRSGKTTAALYKRLRRALSLPRCKNGNRYYSFLVVRDSYGALYDTTIRSWHRMFPASVGKWNGTDGRPANHELSFDTPDGSRLFLRARFVSIQKDSIENLTRGAEFTDVMLEEADLLPEDLVKFCNGRVAQYPTREMLGPGVKASGQVDVVTNPPDTENWFYKRFVEDQLPLHEFFQQPSGLSPEAENIENIPEGRAYYENLAATEAAWYVQRMVHGRFGASRSGEAVYANEYDDTKHCGNRIIEPADVPLLLGFDQNLVNPACTISQWMPSGQWRTIGEVVPGRMGGFRFGGYVREFLRRELKGLPIQNAWIDPSTAVGADTEGGDLTYLESLRKGLGFHVQLAPTQELSARISGISNLLKAPDIVLPSGEKVPAYALSSKCKMLRKGFLSHYRFKRERNDPKARLMPKPDKNEYSDPMDAEAYKINGAFGIHNITGNVQVVPRYQPPKPARPQSFVNPANRGDFDVFKV